MSKFYGDIMRDFNDAYAKSFYGVHPVIFKFKTSPSDCFTIGQSFRCKSRGEESGAFKGYDVANVISLTSNFYAKQVATKIKFSNAAAVGEITYKPKDLNKNGQVFNLKHHSKLEAGTQNVTSTETLKYGASLFSDVKAALNLDYVWGNAAGAEQNVKGAINFTKQDFNFGIKTDYSVGGKKVKSLLAQASYNAAKVNHFFVYDTQKGHLTYATLSKSSYKPDETHACDIVVDTRNKEKWFFGYPVSSSWAGMYRLNPDSTFRMKLFLKDSVSLGASFSQVVNKNFTVSFSHDVKLIQAAPAEGKKAPAPYSFGLQFKFSL